MKNILCIYDSRHAPLGRYALEILLAEGVSGVDECDVARSIPLPETLRKYEVLVLAPVSSDTVESAVLDAVDAGAGLICLRPSSRMAERLGFVNTGKHLSDGHVVFNLGHELYFGELGERLQYHGQADVYEPAENVVSWLEHGGVKSKAPAISVGTHGRGRFAMFAYDLAESTVLFHQGRRELASTGPNAAPDIAGFFTPACLFRGQLDLSLKHVPQADLQQRLLVRLLEWVLQSRPLCRVWMYPDARPAIALINGDSDVMSRPQLEWCVNMAEAYGGKYTINIMEGDWPLLTPEMDVDYQRRGHAVNPHYWLKDQPTPDEMAQHIREATARFEKHYGRQPKSTRHHCVIWPGWVETAQALADAGIGMETNYRAADEQQTGYLTGSGLPMRFINENGEFIECFQQETLLCDDFVLIDKSDLPPLTLDGAIELSHKLIRDALDRYHTVVQIYFHPVYMTGCKVHTGQFVQISRWMESVLQYCQQNDVLMPSVDEWLRFNELRRGVVVESQTWHDASGTCKCEIRTSQPLPGATFAFPASYNGDALESVLLNDQPLRLKHRVISGREMILAAGDLAVGSSKLKAQWSDPLTPRSDLAITAECVRGEG